MIHKLKRVRLCAFLLFICALLASCQTITSPNPTGSNEPTSITDEIRDYFTQIKGNGKDTFTIMVYMNADGSEETYGAASAAIEQMSNAVFSEKLVVVLEVGGAEEWHNAYLEPGESKRMTIHDEGLFTSEEEVEQDMTSLDKLSRFVTSSKASFPADRYGLIFWGNCPFSALDLQKVLSGKNLDFIGFDGTAQPSMETAFMLEPAADYLIAGTNTLAAPWDYEALFTLLSDQSSIETKEIAQNIAQKLSSNSLFKMTETSPVLYCADLTRAPRLASRVLSMYDDLKNDLSIGQFSHIASKRWDNATGQSIYLGGFAEAIGSESAASVLETQQELLAYTSSESFSLTAYFPTANPEGVAQDLATYAAGGINYTPFVSTYMSIVVGADLYQSDGTGDVITPSSAPTDDENQPDSVPSPSEAASPSTTGGDFGNQEMTAQYPWYDASIVTLYRGAWYDTLLFDASSLTLSPSENGESYILTYNATNTIIRNTLNIYLDTGDYAALTTEQLDVDGSHRISTIDQWLSLRGSAEGTGQTIAYAPIGESGLFLSDIALNEKPAKLLFRQEENTYTILGVLQDLGGRYRYAELSTGDLINTVFSQYEVDEYHLSDKGAYTSEILVPIAEAPELADGGVKGDLRVQCVLTDIFGREFRTGLQDIRTVIGGDSGEAGASNGNTSDTDTPGTDGA